MRTPSRTPSRTSLPALLALVLVAGVLVAAGGAVGATAAGRYVITRTSQIKPSVVTELRGNQGPRGPQGARGATGPTGVSGAPGAAGAGKGAYTFVDGPVVVTATTGAVGTVVMTLPRIYPSTFYVVTAEIAITAVVGGQREVICRLATPDGFDNRVVGLPIASAGGTARVSVTFQLYGTLGPAELSCTKNADTSAQVQTIKAMRFAVDDVTTS